MRLRVVKGPTANNPVARAIAKAKVHKALLHAKLRIYTLADGVDDSAYLSGTLMCMQVVGMAAERQWGYAVPNDIARDLSILRGGLSALHQVFTRWDSRQVVAIEQAIDRTEKLNGLLLAVHVFDAYEDAVRMQHEAMRAAGLKDVT